MWQNILNFIFYKTPIFYWTQSLWRDEAFSVWISQDSLSSVISRTANDFNPPFYYLTLHFWMQFFGKNEIISRGLSVLAFLIFLIVIYKFTRKIFSSQKWAVISTLIAAFNPMILYYAFELRMYAFLYLLATMSMYFLYTENWLGYIIASTLGIYTQPFMFLVLVSQIPYFIFTKKLITGIKCALSILILYIPWIMVIIGQFKQSGPMWIYPVTMDLIQASLGNLFMGFEGTPGNFWIVTKIISLILLIISFWVLKTKVNKKITLLTLCWIYIPLTIVLGYSLKKPIYVNRYVIFIACGEIMLLSLFLFQIKNKLFQKILTVIFIGASFLGNYWAISFHQKVNIRNTFEKINYQTKSDDIIIASSPLVFYESLYYRPGNLLVYLYNPEKIIMPKYVGSDGMGPETWALSYPKYPKRAFLIEESGEYKIVSE